MVQGTQTLEDLCPEEQTAVKQLRQRMVGFMDPKLFENINVFVRFLRARDLNINAAEAMLKKHLEWRKTIQLDEIEAFTPCEALQKHSAFDVLGQDREGAPVIYSHVGHFDSRGMLKCTRKMDIVKFIVQKIEKAVSIMQEESAKRGKHIDKLIIILNVENLPFSVATHKETLELAGRLVVLYEANYPERLKAAYILNAASYFMMAFSIVKRFLSPVTYSKLNFFGKDGWKEEILKIIEPGVWPAFLGGTRTDPDGNPLCKTVMKYGGSIPESLYINKTESSLVKEPGVRKLNVGRMSKTQLTLNVTEAGFHIEWEFETKSRDIAFSLLYKPNYIDSRIKELIPKQRVDTSILAEMGTFKCHNPGIYIIEFDNSYSWIFQKEIYYKVAVVRDSIVVDK